jgi:hypothetical protein
MWLKPMYLLSMLSLLSGKDNFDLAKAIYTFKTPLCAGFFIYDK